MVRYLFSDAYHSYVALVKIADLRILQNGSVAILDKCLTKISEE